MPSAQLLSLGVISNSALKTLALNSGPEAISPFVRLCVCVCVCVCSRPALQITPQLQSLVREERLLKETPAQTPKQGTMAFTVTSPLSGRAVAPSARFSQGTQVGARCTYLSAVEEVGGQQC